MARFLSLVVSSLLAAQGLAKPFDSRVAPAGWKLQGPADDRQAIKLQIALRQGDVEGFEKAVLDMSTPNNPKYGQHFQNYDEVKQMLLPSDESVSSVYSWLSDVGVSNVEQDADWLTFNTTVGVANKMLDTKFSWFVSNEAKPRKVLRTLEYSIPGQVAEHINLVQPTTRFTSVRADHTFKNQAAAIGAANITDNCDEVITPDCLKNLYQINYEADAKSGSKVGFASYLEEYARFNDFSLFQDSFFPGTPKHTFSVVKFHGGGNNQTFTGDSAEANLDAQYIYTTGHPLPITEFSTGGRAPLIPDLDQPVEDQNEPYINFLRSVLKLPADKLPQVITTSYGENEQSVPKSYALTVCNLIAQLSSRGVSVLFSSGDFGVGSACLSNDGKNTTMFQPQYPATCPWVTSVGATQFLNETAAFFSSGGFSNIWSRPSWQDAAVKAYLERIGDKNKPYYNVKGRGFPDVSAQGVDYAVYDKGRLVGLDGTSCASPAFAGIIGLLNDARLRANKTTLGFLNPLLYQNPNALNDVTLGGSTGCDGLSSFRGLPNGSPIIPFASWNATPGWDPVSGLGTPNFPALHKLVMSR
ncbi:subtilisin-like protein [Xylaria nigripes]|nr:subtilisin-like protein [Xylaria nigripes]